MHGEMIPVSRIEKLPTMKILFVSGKGGVGKSTIAAALALKSARSGAKTLLVELGNRSFFSLALGQNFENSPKSWREGLDVALWDGPSCLHEYAVHLIKSEALYRLFFENSVSKALIQVAPGLAELAMLGKITSGPPRNVGPKMPYDTLVVDAFASGHFLAMLRAPLGFAEAIRRGPMGEQSRAIIEVLRDSKICQYHFVTLPEELPVQETQELITDFRKIVLTPPKIWLNRWLATSLVEKLTFASATDPFLADLLRRRAHERAAETAFASEQTATAPWILSNDFEECVLQLADHFQTEVAR